jgi:hypothetical protein
MSFNADSSAATNLSLIKTNMGGGYRDNYEEQAAPSGGINCASLHLPSPSALILLQIKSELQAHCRSSRSVIGRGAKAMLTSLAAYQVSDRPVSRRSPSCCCLRLKLTER